MRILTKDETTRVERPEHGPWQWPHIVNVMISDSYKVDQTNELLMAANGDPLQQAYAVNFLETLYAHGFVVAQVEDITE